MHSGRIPPLLAAGLASEYDVFYLAYGDSPSAAGGLRGSSIFRDMR